MPPPQHSPIAAKPSKHGLFLGLAGLVLTAIGLVALIELFPRLSATATPPTNLDRPLESSRFTITNDGYVKVTDVSSLCFLWKVTLGSVRFQSGTVEIVKPPEAKLSPTESMTVPCSSEKMRLVGSPPPYRQPRLTEGDLAIVVYYRVWPFTFYRDRRLFRFAARFGEHGEITWEKQPAAIMEADFEKWLVTHGGFNIVERP